MVAVVIVGVLVRVGYVLLVVDEVALGADAIWYQLQGTAIREGIGYVVPTSLFEPVQVSTATFPPAYPAYQAVWQAIVGTAGSSVRLAGIVPGAATITLTGVVGRRALGPAAGLVAAALVALDPTLVSVDGSAMSENLTVPLVLAVLLVASRIVDRGPTSGRLLLLGVLWGVAVLARQDLVLLAVATIPTVAHGWFSCAESSREGRFRVQERAGVGSIGRVGLVLAAVAVVVGPWAWRNHEAVGRFTISTVSPSSALAGANCDETYAGESLGSWSFACTQSALPAGELSELEVVDAQQSAAVDHARANLGRLPLVAVAREARVWALWDPRDLARRDADESRRYGWQLASRPFDAAIAVLGVVGLAVAIRRRWQALDSLLLMTPVMVVAVSAVVSYGNPRFNAIAHPVLLIGVVALFQSGGGERRNHDIEASGADVSSGGRFRGR